MLKSATLIHVPVLKQDQPCSDASLSQQLACPRFYLQIRSSPLYLTADVGRPELRHDGSCRSLKVERCWIEYWWKSFVLFPKKKKKGFLSSSADWVSALRAQDEEEFLRCQGPLQIPSQLPSMLVDTDNIRSKQNVVVKMSCVLKCVCAIPELQKVPTTQRVSQPTLLPEQNPSDTWRWVHTLLLTHTHLHTVPVSVDWRRNVFCLT